MIRFVVALAAAAVILPSPLSGQEVRRAQPVEEPPTGRAVPFDKPTLTPTPRPKASAVPVKPAVPAATLTPTPAVKPHPVEATPAPPKPFPPAAGPDTSSPDEGEPSRPGGDSESPEARQLSYANAFYARKLYDLAVPEYEKFLGQFPGASGRASAFFLLGQCYRSLGRTPAARSSFQSVLDEYPESEFAGPAAYGVGEIEFNQKSYSSALPLFHRAAGKTKEAALALSAHYFEARCLESLNKKEEARLIYAEVAESKGSNPYREDARNAAATIALAQGKKLEAFKQYEALSSEAQKPALKSEAAIRAGLLLADLQQADKSKVDKATVDRAVGLLQRGRTGTESAKLKGLATIGLVRLQYQSGNFAQVVAEYKKSQADVPEEMKAEVMLLVANSHRQLNQAKEAEEVYQTISEKYPDREEAKDADYQRLINLYNSGAPDLEAQIDAFLATNPQGERGDQARLLKAEALYKQGKFTEAAPLYEQLRESQLAPKLRAEAAYKLASAKAQLKETDGLIQALTYFITTFPDHAQVATALFQRAAAYQEQKDYGAALADLNLIVAQFPKAREREGALQQKALILGQQENGKEMAQTFQQLLKEYPKTTVAAQANYFIGKTAFEAKNYKQAIGSLNTARTLDKAQYYQLATVRIISSHFYLRDRPNLVKEVDAFLASGPEARVPSEILEWLGLEFYNEKKFEPAEKYLAALGRGDSLAGVKPDFLFYLAEVRMKRQNLAGAEEAYQRYLQVANDPAGKAKALLALGDVKIAAHKPDEAQRIAEEIMTQQPEGKVNAEARLLLGQVQIERAQFEEAGRSFMGVALLYDDPGITPRALQKAAAAYGCAGKTAEAERANKELRERFPGFTGG